jgi:hypothetical protein
MKVKYTIKSILFPSEDPEKVKYTPIAQNVKTILEWANKIGLIVVSTEVSLSNTSWELVLDGTKLQQAGFKDKLTKEAAELYNITSKRKGWFN